MCFLLLPPLAEPDELLFDEEDEFEPELGPLLPPMPPSSRLLLESEPFCWACCCCNSVAALTISCFASEVLVPGLVRLIFILSPLSSVA